MLALNIRALTPEAKELIEGVILTFKPTEAMQRVSFLYPIDADQR